MNLNPPVTLLGLTFQELSRMVADAGQPPYRARQLFHGLYVERVENMDDMTTLSTDFREALKAAGLGVGLPKIENKFVSGDGTVRYLIAFADGQSVETVWMPEGDGASIHVDFVFVQPKEANTGERLRREGLIELDHADVRRLQSCLLQGFE